MIGDDEDVGLVDIEDDPAWNGFRDEAAKIREAGFDVGPDVVESLTQLAQLPEFEYQRVRKHQPGPPAKRHS